ncbi:zinc-binding dehydrogenase [Nocardia fusca]|uniref:zinc-binding dehydrogenase n=1 Tax=Nocardia fusca TaxID=941183 RepID=UPI003791E56A
MARQFGATDVIDASQDDPVQAVLDSTGGGVDYAFEVAGLSSATQQAYAMLGPAAVRYCPFARIPPALAGCGTVLSEQKLNCSYVFRSWYAAPVQR